jgi:hypothetical protein
MIECLSLWCSRTLHRYASAFITPAFFIFLCLPGVYEDRAAFYRETSSGLYKKSLYALSFQLASIPYLIVAATINSAICYHLIPLREGGYGFYWVMFTSFMVMAWMQGIAIGALTPSMAIGTAAVMAPLNSECVCGYGWVGGSWWCCFLSLHLPRAVMRASKLRRERYCTDDRVYLLALHAQFPTSFADLLLLVETVSPATRVHARWDSYLSFFRRTCCLCQLGRARSTLLQFGQFRLQWDGGSDGCTTSTRRV